MLNRISIKTKSNVILILFLPVILCIAFYIYSLSIGPTYKSEITINLNVSDINNSYIRKIEPKFNDKLLLKKIFFNKVFNEVNFNKSLDFFYANNSDLETDKYNPPINAINPVTLGDKDFSSDLIYLMNKKQILNLIAVLNSKLFLYENEVIKLNPANYIFTQDIILNKNFSVIKTSSKILPFQGFVLGVILTILIITTKKFFFKKK